MISKEGDDMIKQIKIESVHYELSDATKTFIEEKLTKLDYLNKIITDGFIRVVRDSEKYKIEADLHLQNKQRIYIKNTDDKLYPAIENLVHKLKHKLSEVHKKMTSHKKPHHKETLHHKIIDQHPTEEDEE